MKPKPDYEGFGRHQIEINKLGIAQSINDLIALAFSYHLPIPRDIIDTGRVRRDDLVYKLADYWRRAENWYLETGLDTLKQKIKKIQDRLHLNEHELELLESSCNNSGI